MTARSAPRVAWDALPPQVRDAVEGVLGAPVVAAESRPGGWSPGSADLVTAADGRRAFVKAASADVNAQTAALHRREADVLRLLDGRAAPRLLAEVDAPPWVALVVEAVDGGHPDPASPAETAAVLDAVAALPDAPAGSVLGRLEDELAEEALGWVRLQRDGAPLSEPASRALPGLIELAARCAEALAGDSVVHGDLRSDNVLVGDGGARLIDWPSAVVGVRWFDAVTFALDVRHRDGDLTAAEDHRLLREAPTEGVDVLLAVLGAYFFDRSRTPEPPGLPGIRAYQRAQGDTVLAWLLERRPDLLRRPPR